MLKFNPFCGILKVLILLFVRIGTFRKGVSQMIYGYCRISTKQQSIERQIRNIKAAYPDAHIIEEAYSGRTVNRPKWNDLYNKIKPGDTVVFDSVSRMSRDAAEGWQLYEKLFQDGVELVFLKESHINTAVYREALAKQIDLSVKTGDEATDELMNNIISSLNKFQMDLAKKQIELAFQQAQKEVDDLRQRTREGIQTARINGKQVGQMTGKKLKVKKEEPAKQIIQKHSKAFGGNLTDIECMKLAGLSRNTYYKYKRELLLKN